MRHLFAICSNLLVLLGTALAYPPVSEDDQERFASIIAWCEVVSIDLLEQPRIELGLSSQMRRYTLRVTEVEKGDAKVGDSFTLNFAHYELLTTADTKHIACPEIFVWEIYRRPQLRVSMEYRAFLRKSGTTVEPLHGRWSMLRERTPKDLYVRLVGKKEVP